MSFLISRVTTIKFCDTQSFAKIKISSIFKKNNDRAFINEEIMEKL